jgi:hypothetical protein
MEEEKIIRSHQQRSSNKKEIRTAAEQIRIDLRGRSIRHVPEQRAISEYNSRSQEQGWIDGLTAGLAVADHFGYRIYIAVGSASKRTKRDVPTCQRSWKLELVPGRWV